MSDVNTCVEQNVQDHCGSCTIMLTQMLTIEHRLSKLEAQVRVITALLAWLASVASSAVAYIVYKGGI